VLGRPRSQYVGLRLLQGPVFFVNSRPGLFSAASGLDGRSASGQSAAKGTTGSDVPFYPRRSCPRTGGSPYPEVTGSICRVPWRGFSRSPEDTHPRRPVSVCGTDARDARHGAFLGRRATLARHVQRRVTAAHRRPPVAVHRGRGRNINRLLHRLRLSASTKARLTRRRRTLRRKPSACGAPASHRGLTLLVPAFALGRAPASLAGRPSPLTQRSPTTPRSAEC
jgi:hypothetical protein